MQYLGTGEVLLGAVIGAALTYTVDKYRRWNKFHWQESWSLVNEVLENPQKILPVLNTPQTIEETGSGGRTHSRLDGLDFLVYYNNGGFRDLQRELGEKCLGLGLIRLGRSLIDLSDYEFSTIDRWGRDVRRRRDPSLPREDLREHEGTVKAVATETKEALLGRDVERSSYGAMDNELEGLPHFQFPIHLPFVGAVRVHPLSSRDGT